MPHRKYFPDGTDFAALFMALFGETSHSVSVKGRDRRYIVINPAVESRFGRSSADIRGKTASELFGTRLGRAIERFDDDVLADGEVRAYEQRLPFPSGAREFLIRKVPLRDTAGAIVGVMTISHELTEQSITEAALRASEHRYRVVAENLGEGVAIVRPDLTFAYANAAAERLFGVATGELTRCNLLDFLSPADRAMMMEQSANRRAGRTNVFHHDIVAKDGAHRHLLVTASPQSDAFGEYEATVAIFRDITEQERAREELARAKEQAEDAAATKARFVATVSHELRTPLHAICGLGRLLSRSELSEEQQRWTRTLRTSAEGLLALINDLLDFSALESGKLTIDVAQIDPRDVVEEVVGLVAETARERGLRLAAEVDDATPDDFRADARRLRQVLLNLVGNALKFTNEGRVTVQVAPMPTSGSEGDARRLRFEVRDTGIGISESGLGRIFQAFHQEGDWSTRSVGGTGLGLSISRELVVAMGGNIGASSEGSDGSTFWFEIPEAPESALVATPPGRRIEPVEDEERLISAPRPLRAAARVLVVEDNEANRLLVRETLREAGVGRLAEAETGERALALLATGRMDAVLMDCMMPGINGLDATRQLRAEGGANADVPVIALTAQASAGDRERCFEAGCDDYLAKPFEMEELVSKLDFWLARGRRRFVANRATTPPPLIEAPAFGHADEGDAPAEALLDRDRLASISRGDVAFLRRYLGLWQKNAAAATDTISTLFGGSLSATDLDAIRAAAHQLKGSSANAGLARMAACSSVLEQLCRAALESPEANGTARAGIADAASSVLRVHPLTAAAVDEFLAALPPGDPA